MFAYLVRRVIGAVVLLFIVTAVTFSIFFLVPRLGGATADDLASRYVGKSAGAAQIHETAVRLGFTDPLYVQYGRFMKGLVVGQDYNYGPATEHCPAPCFGYSFLTQQPVWPDLVARIPVTISLAVGAAVIWLITGVGTGVVSALRRGSVLDRSLMSRGAGRCLAADLLHRSAGAVDLQLRPRLDRAGRRRTRWTRPTRSSGPTT